jgi:uncharacterized membrane protein YfcA
VGIQLDIEGYKLVILGAAAFVAGVQNALAGGGSFLTLPALMLTGIGPRAANVTSTVALFPGQVATGIAGWASKSGLPGLGLRALAAISLVGGALGALLLLNTSEQVFAALIPWLVLFATLAFGWGSFLRKPRAHGHHLGPMGAGSAQLAISIYGGYFGGGIGILMLSALTLAGMPVRAAGATKNVLAGAINASAVLIFVGSHDVAWFQAAIVGAFALAGGQLGAYMLRTVNERLLRICIVVLGLALSVGLFVRAAGP